MSRSVPVARPRSRRRFRGGRQRDGADRDREGGRHPLRPAAVHRHHRPRQGGDDPDPPAGGLGQSRHLVRRLVDRGLHPDRRVRPVPDAGHGHLRRDPLAAGLRPARHGARDLRRVHAARRAVRRRPALRPAPPGGARPGARLRREHGSRAGVLPVPPRRDRQDRAAPARPGRLLRLLDRPRPGSPPGHGRRARGLRDLGRGGPSRGRGRPARDRLRVLGRPEDRRQRAHLQVRAQGDRPAPRPVRHVHAQAHLRDQRLGDAHPPEPLLDRGGAQRVRRSRPTRTGSPTSPARTWPASSPTRGG